MFLCIGKLDFDRKKRAKKAWFWKMWCNFYPFFNRKMTHNHTQSLKNNAKKWKKTQKYVGKYGIVAKCVLCVNSFWLKNKAKMRKTRKSPHDIQHPTPARTWHGGTVAWGHVFQTRRRVPPRIGSHIRIKAWVPLHPLQPKNILCYNTSTISQQKYSMLFF